MRILVIRLKSMGDVVFTLPALDRLRNVFPEARLACLVSRECAPVTAGFARVDEVIELDRAALRRGRPGVRWVALRELLRRVVAGRFDLVIDLQSYGETALLTWLTRAPRRWGWFEKRLRAYAYTRAVPRRSDLHPADSFCSVLTGCGLAAGDGRNTWCLPAEGKQEAERFLAEHRLDPASPLLFVQPFSSTPAKDWPLERLLAVAKTFRIRECQAVFGGGPADRERLEVVRQAGFPVSAGISLLGAAGLAARATVVLGGDTGLVHLAVALGRRVVMLMRSVRPGACVPYRHPEWAVTPVDGRSVAEIQTDAVTRAVGDALQEAGSR